jgi:hypothetical protein
MTPEEKASVRTLAHAVGVREAARQCNLSQDMVRKWSSREHWFARPARPIPESPTVTKARNLLDSYGKNTRLRLAKSANKASKRFASMEGDELIAEKVSQAANNWTNVAAKIHGWGESEPAEGALNLRVLAGRAGRTRVLVETENQPDNVNMTSTVEALPG